jgi:hypothetical protein
MRQVLPHVPSSAQAYPHLPPQVMPQAKSSVSLPVSEGNSVCDSQERLFGMLAPQISSAAKTTRNGERRRLVTLRPGLAAGLLKTTDLLWFVAEYRWREPLPAADALGSGLCCRREMNEIYENPKCSTASLIEWPHCSPAPA